MKIEVLYPEICNLYGDLGNIRYLQKSCPELEVVETDLKSRPAFLDGGVDLVYVGSATERGLQLLVEALTPYRDARGVPHAQAPQQLLSRKVSGHGHCGLQERVRPHLSGR